MTNEKTPLTDTAAKGATTMGEKVSDATTDVKHKVADLGRTATHTIDDNRNAAASGLDKAATALRDNAGSLPGGETVSKFAHSAADTLSTTAGYVRDHDVNRMMADVEALVKKNPGPSLLAAAAIGFLVARAFNND